LPKGVSNGKNRKKQCSFGLFAAAILVAARGLASAPTKPGEYPYVCSFPGHWTIMKGVMVVK
jgi:hypothetical protein